MCREIEKLAESRYAEGQAEGKAEGEAMCLAQLMRNTGKTFDEAALLMGFSPEKADSLQTVVEQLAKVQN